MQFFHVTTQFYFILIVLNIDCKYLITVFKINVQKS